MNLDGPPLEQLVTIVRAGAGVDAYGQPVEDWDTATRTVVWGRVADVAIGDELTQDGRRGTVTRPQALLEPDADVRAHDRLEVVERGAVQSYEVDGKPVWPNVPGGSPPHVFVQLLDVEG